MALAAGIGAFLIDLALSRDPPCHAAWRSGWCSPVPSATPSIASVSARSSTFSTSTSYGHHWPAFNVADSAIVIGAGLILLDSLVLSQARTKLGREEG